MWIPGSSPWTGTGGSRRSTGPRWTSWRSQEKDVLHKRYDEAFAFIQLDPIRDLFRKLEQGHGRAEEEMELTVRGRILTVRMRVSAFKDGSGARDRFRDHLRRSYRTDPGKKGRDLAGCRAENRTRVQEPAYAHQTFGRAAAQEARGAGARTSTAVFDECSRTIVQEADGLRKLVDEFANFARMPGSNPVPQPLAPVIESAAKLYTVAHKDIRVQIDLPPNMPDVVLDSEQMKRVFINLFENAVEAMGGRGTIRVSSRMTAGGMAQIEVADEGPGHRRGGPPETFPTGFFAKEEKERFRPCHRAPHHQGPQRLHPRMSGTNPRERGS